MAEQREFIDSREGFSQDERAYREYLADGGDLTNAEFERWLDGLTCMECGDTVSMCVCADDPQGDEDDDVCCPACGCWVPNANFCTQCGTEL